MFSEIFKVTLKLKILHEALSRFYLPDLFSRQQRSEQNFTVFQSFSHFLCHAKGFSQAAQIFDGKFDLLYFFLSVLSATIFSMTEVELFQIIDELSFVNEEFYAAKVAPQRLDKLLSEGWRHFGAQFFRYNLGFHEGEIQLVLPLRIRLADFSLSKSQRRVLHKNCDLETIIRPAEITEETEILFEKHKKRFKTGVPDSIYDFLDFDAANVPCETLEVCVYEKNKLFAASFFDVGATTVSAVYAMFEPQETTRSLGIFTMLLTIDFAVKNGKTFYYPGYAYEGNSFYDYKKRFAALEKFDWKGNWKIFEK